MNMIYALLLALFAAGCVPAPTIQHTPYHYDGTTKPRLALISMINSSDCMVPWHLDEELSNTLRYQLMCNGNLYLIPEAQVNHGVKEMSSHALFSPDLSFTKKMCESDYVVALELIDHEVVPFERDKVSACYPAEALRCSSMLQIKLRLKVIDLTSGCAKVILQEIFTSNTMIPRETECIDYERFRWGTPGFQSTPWGLAHKRLIRDLACRIEIVIQGL